MTIKRQNTALAECHSCRSARKNWLDFTNEIPNPLIRQRIFNYLHRNEGAHKLGIKVDYKKYFIFL